VEKQPAISRLRRDFPEFANRSEECSEWCGRSADRIPDVYEFARLVTNLFAQSKRKRVQEAFDRIEEFLRVGSPEVRDWVYGFLEALQDVAPWRPSGSEDFVRFLGSETFRAWTALDAIRTDLEDCSTLEAEVLMWRVVHHAVPQAAGEPVV